MFGRGRAATRRSGHSNMNAQGPRTKPDVPWELERETGITRQRTEDTPIMTGPDNSALINEIKDVQYNKGSIYTNIASFLCAMTTEEVLHPLSAQS